MNFILKKNKFLRKLVLNYWKQETILNKLKLKTLKQKNNARFKIILHIFGLKVMENSWLFNLI